MTTVLAERNTGMNWEIAAAKSAKLTAVLESAKASYPHECTTEIKSKQESDGTPYGATAPFYYLQVVGPDYTDARFIKGIKDVLEAI